MSLGRSKLICASLLGIKNKKWSIAGISYLVLPNQHFPSMIKFKRVYEAMWMMNYFQHSEFFSRRRYVVSLSPFYSSFQGQCSEEPHSSASPVQNFTARSHHTTYIESHISFVFHWYERSSITTDFFPRSASSKEQTPERMLPRPLQSIFYKPMRTLFLF